MSNNMFQFFIFVYVAASILGGVMAGIIGLKTTILTEDLAIDATIMTVHSTDGFNPQSDVLLVDKERICYTGVTGTTFTGLTRGGKCRKGSSAAPHTAIVDGQENRVYSETPGVIASLIGFDIAEAFVDTSGFGMVVGLFQTVAQLPNFINAVARMLIWDQPFFDGPYVYIRYMILSVFTGGMVMGLVRMALGR